jgi:hypothetical protein
MHSHQHSIPVSFCVAQHNASTPSTCSTPDRIAPDTSVRSASVPIAFPQEGGLAPPPRPGGAVVLCRMRMPCRLLCWAWQGTLKSCDILCGMARSCLRMMTCGSPCGSCASLTPPLLFFIFPIFCSVVRASSSSRQPWGLSYPHQTAMCVYPTPWGRWDARQTHLIFRYSAAI